MCSAFVKSKCYKNVNNKQDKESVSSEGGKSRQHSRLFKQRKSLLFSGKIRAISILVMHIFFEFFVIKKIPFSAFEIRYLITCTTYLFVYCIFLILC